MKTSNGIKIAINGLGRIGRIFLKQSFGVSGWEIVAVNDLADRENLVYLLEHDSVYGRFSAPKDKLDKIKFLQEKDPSKLPWKDLDIDIVVESTGIFSSYEKAKAHLDAGAKRVVITAPVPKDDGDTVTFNPNVGEGVIAKSKITSNASCTTGAVTPVAMILSQALGIKKAILNTVHGYTATQNLVDGPNKKDYRRGRAAATNIVPSSTGAADATSKAIPEMEGKFDGIAMRVPVISGSIIDFTFVSEKPTSVEEVNNIFREACKKLEWEGIIKVTEEPLTSTDILKEPFGSIVDLSMTRVVDGDLVKILSWYDNEWGYCAMLVKHIQSLKNYL
ncbi:type I glyceraldehyde-3-phosphate dehydrogenase [Patescibacteria group bacterium]|nr:type I glyceraldehyde-3-phosphate dehydrogenase [Patescibacteria group bacterium]MBU2633005.1 type I glyceraldehyde-3-phosphate dehydrogenase [Patescibacteria group bacterium]